MQLTFLNAWICPQRARIRAFSIAAMVLLLYNISHLRQILSAGKLRKYAVFLYKLESGIEPVPGVRVCGSWQSSHPSSSGAFCNTGQTTNLKTGKGPEMMVKSLK